MQGTPLGNLLGLVLGQGKVEGGYHEKVVDPETGKKKFQYKPAEVENKLGDWFQGGVAKKEAAEKNRAAKDAAYKQAMERRMKAFMTDEARRLTNNLGRKQQKRYDASDVGYDQAVSGARAGTAENRASRAGSINNRMAIEARRPFVQSIAGSQASTDSLTAAINEALMGGQLNNLGKMLDTQSNEIDTNFTKSGIALEQAKSPLAKLMMFLGRAWNPNGTLSDTNSTVENFNNQAKAATRSSEVEQALYSLAAILKGMGIRLTPEQMANVGLQAGGYQLPPDNQALAELMQRFSKKP